ncbi:hypothetical protein SUGI_0010620 [Cryptomeria japonica]|uniref:pentatricopeptide repeat-containing protein At5g59600 n=1 Tax=Cryptomeria japonica TaxID=3369 RepID=UPI0024089584|nr:pentatricopeptide repeat-containing protein At5g59600 [Cryptomeria japonica]GLJ05083.1 hypothetical protein SUGI_0010620 [Cryptomeria japonica]
MSWRGLLATYKNEKKKEKLLLIVWPLFHHSYLMSFTTTVTKSAIKTMAIQGNRSMGNEKCVDVIRLCKQGRLKEALHILHFMDQHNMCSYSSALYVHLLQICIKKRILPQGKLVQAHIIQTGFQIPCNFVWNKIVTMYVQLGSLVEVRKVFDEIPERNVASWTTMIAAYIRRGYAEHALGLFCQMKKTHIQPDEFTFASILPAYAELRALCQGKQVHRDIIRRGFHSDVFVGSALIDMYSKCGSIEDAHHVFNKMPQRNVVTWNAIIAGFAKNGQVEEALKLFHEMPERDVISWNVIISGFERNGFIDEALELFQKMPERNIVSWNSMIAGCVQNGRSDKALELFEEMQVTGLKPDLETFSSVLPACSILAALQHGKMVHEHVIRSGLQFDSFVESALIDMYSKCGCIPDAHKVFDKIPKRDVVSWTVMIIGYAMNGCAKEALLLFEVMQQSGMRPDHVTFTGVLSACSHAGLVDDGWLYFNCMVHYYHIKPTLDHYCCMVDLLGRAACLNEAVDFIKRMPVKPDAAVWGSLLGACRIHANLELGEYVAKYLFELDPENPAHYVTLSNIYSLSGRWDGTERVRTMMKERMLEKKPGCSWIEVNNKVFSFVEHTCK